MKHFLFLIAAFTGFVQANSQDKWKLFINEKLVRSGVINEIPYEVSLTGHQLKKSDKVKIKFISEENDPEWKRTFFITDKDDNNITSIELPAQSGSFLASTKVINDIILKKKEVNVYTITSPKDSAKASNIRIKRTMIARISWQ